MWVMKKLKETFLLNSVHLFLMTLALTTNNVVKQWTVACFVIKTLDIHKHIEINCKKLWYIDLVAYIQFIEYWNRFWNCKIFAKTMARSLAEGV